MWPLGSHSMPITRPDDRNLTDDKLRAAFRGNRSNRQFGREANRTAVGRPEEPPASRGDRSKIPWFERVECTDKQVTGAEVRDARAVGREREVSAGRDRLGQIEPAERRHGLGLEVPRGHRRRGTQHDGRRHPQRRAAPVGRPWEGGRRIDRLRQQDSRLADVAQAQLLDRVPGSAPAGAERCQACRPATDPAEDGPSARPPASRTRCRPRRGGDR